MKTVSVYCASSSKALPSYYEAAAKAGECFAKAKIRVVFGGGKAGLMGAMADGLLQNGGHATGVIPRFMCDEGWHHDGLTELKIVETMHERKALMAAMADAVVAMPGGIGTFDELFEIITWKQLGLFNKPIVILNTNNYFRYFLQLIQHAESEKFIRNEHRQIWQVVETPEEVLPAIENAMIWPDDARQFAAV
ncbi:TIGR00730 family Rossman fold protein [Microbacter margulisiae]|uniref:Cytokinin riboside 5'-monophosphate phosphoribohydrolase n=1 Tax=Microbacter margulisiae TaxID=1350067 RepID=A0A7W5DTD5_9PORP|nr:hypothetical protein [Microbacter margulisiae]